MLRAIIRTFLTHSVQFMETDYYFHMFFEKRFVSGMSLDNSLKQASVVGLIPHKCSFSNILTCHSLYNGLKRILATSRMAFVNEVGMYLNCETQNSPEQP